MKTSSVVGLLVLAAVLLGGTYWLTQRNTTVTKTNTYRPSAAITPTRPSNPVQVTPTQTGSSTTPVTATHVSTTSPVTAPKSQSFKVQASDTKANLTTITVAKGTPTTITFAVDANNTYHGGLDFRSAQLSTGTILPGKSKTISFTATTTFSFTPYWPATNTKKPYVITVVVK
jgi:hypothetical protein